MAQMQALAASQWGVWAYPAALPEVLGTHIAEALGSPRLHPLCPLGLPLLVDASIGQLQLFWARHAALGSSEMGLNPLSMAKHGTSLALLWKSAVYFPFFLPPVTLIQCQPCAKHCPGHL